MSSKNARLPTIFALMFAGSLWWAPVAAQIRTDASLGLPAQNLSGAQVLIPQNLGRLAGNNLFHSFQTFHVQNGQSAVFTTNHAGLANVIARVTGGTASVIEGDLRLQAVGSTPNFFFINPAGVTFGTGAMVDVPGAFYVSTANYLKFPDGHFYADSNSASTFSSATPEAFGFLANGSISASAAVQAINANPAGAAGQPPRPSLFLGTDKSINVIAGGVTIDNSVIGNESGDVRIVALGRPSQNLEVALSGGQTNATGELLIRNGGQINSSTNSHKEVGSVSVYAGNILIDKAGASRSTGILSQADRGASGRTGQMEILATGDLTVRNGGIISASNGAQATDPASLTPGHMRITAQNIILDNGMIAANSFGNVDASRIELQAQGAIRLDHSASIQGTTSGSGNANAIVLHAVGDVSIADGSYINGNTSSSGQAASVSISAANVSLDGKGRSAIVSSEALGQQGAALATGSGNLLEITTPGRVTLLNAAQLKSSTNTRGDAGKIRIRAAEIEIDGQDNVQAQTGIINTTIGQGNSGDIDIDVSGALRVKGLGEINASAYGPAGKAGTIRLAAASMSLEGMKEFHGTLTLPDGTQRAVDGYKSSAISSEAGSNSAGQTGDVTIAVTGEMAVSNGAKISVSNLANPLDPSLLNARDDAQKPNLTVTAGSLLMDEKAMITASTGGNVNASQLVVATTTGDVELRNGASLQAATSGAGHAGEIRLGVARHLRMTAGGNLQSSTAGAGDAGSIRVRANDIHIDGQTKLQTGMFSAATQNASGNAGEVMVAAQGTLSLQGGAQLSVQNDARTSNGSTAASPSVLLVLARNITLNGAQTQITAASSGNFDASQIKIVATGEPIPVGKPDFATLTAKGDLKIGKGSSINGNTSGAGKGASIAIKAGSLDLHGEGGMASISSESMRAQGAAAPATTGDGGSVEIWATNLSLKNGGQIKTSTATAGKAGVATLLAEQILIDGADNPEILTGIVGATTAAGDSQKIAVTATDSLSIVRLGQIVASTNGAGQAGNIEVRAGAVQVDGHLKTAEKTYTSNISAEAGRSSSGRTGNLSLAATRSIRLSNGGKLSVQNYASVSPEAAAVLNDSGETRPQLSLSAPDISLIDAQITAASIGNVNASNIAIDFSDRLYLDPSAISTSANTGDGGAINIRGGRLMVLDKSIVSTSVTGLVGFNGNPANGGNINVTVDNLLLMNGFIQANTAASNASGGNVSLAINNLVPSGNTLYLGGQTAYSFRPYVFGYNVIQAAAPTGISGNIQISSPTLDLAGALSGLKTERVDTGGLGRSPCQAAAGSSFVQAGRGGFAPSARSLLGPSSAPMPVRPAVSSPALPLARLQVECQS